MQLAMDMADYRNNASWRLAFTTSIKLPIILCLISYFLIHDVAAARCVVLKLLQLLQLQLFFLRELHMLSTLISESLLRFCSEQSSLLIPFRSLLIPVPLQC